ncbi:tetratricopeptide repeat protein [Aliivibrio sp. S4TY2]|uniref:YfgM family protein n=1 Tax=unclassified Aliivibrio TaxID=2645654 RepID=UPI002379CF8F|nr:MULTISPECIES: tetratricopeptide repeat protein [unclassified Aliivibrio]MDD9157171.1 tetratricopeptide repeat protein [Aliivibrio sp. S4TY2]MDD9160996.1 tetratricopeptide repeat protein [Aliivibrio sp. S4TY1]MDD9165083.1 tetratricopeptide repeat protein [Aliivibrio sp. S4MY2]MDD9169024.1 tetratricopeptide repeat protein [Aliivibrio sp. S4MY4]MDD9185752.1 tetratricopeptide repeat protein [Aliivibrio sp. S4MY3]
MEAYETEEQQVEAIKSWWKENGKAVVVGGVVGIGAILGWKYYQSAQIEAKDTASMSYEKTLTALQASGAEGAESTQAFINANEKSEYATLAALQLAKVQVEAGQLDNAITQLNWIASNSKDESLIATAQVRIARIQAQQEQFDAALTTLSTVKPVSWAARVAEVKGDIALRQGDIATARTAYTEALQAGMNQAVQMKLDDLAE